MKKTVAAIIIVFCFGKISAQQIPDASLLALNTTTGVTLSNLNTSNNQPATKEKTTETYNGTNKFKPQALKGMKPLLLTGNSILINPDPSVDQVTIINDELPLNEVRIENASGQIVADKKTDATVAGVKVNVDVSTLPAGLYFITTLSGDRTETGNIIVIR